MTENEPNQNAHQRAGQEEGVTEIRTRESMATQAEALHRLLLDDERLNAAWEAEALAHHLRCGEDDDAIRRCRRLLQEMRKRGTRHLLAAERMKASLDSLLRSEPDGPHDLERVLGDLRKAHGWLLHEGPQIALAYGYACPACLEEQPETQRVRSVPISEIEAHPTKSLLARDYLGDGRDDATRGQD